MKCSSSLSQTEKDHFWMQHALELAQKAESQGEVPVGAVLVKNDELFAEGWNQTIQLNDPTAHAEMVAIRQAGSVQKNYRLPELTLYVTLEPCPMCAGAIVHARLARIVVATRDLKTGAAGSLMDLIQHPLLNHQAETTFDVCQLEASSLLSQFFKKRRSEHKLSKQKSKKT